MRTRRIRTVARGITDAGAPSLVIRWHPNEQIAAGYLDALLDINDPDESNYALAAAKTAYSHWRNDERIAIGPDHWSFILQTIRLDVWNPLTLISGTSRSGQMVPFSDFLITRYRAHRMIPSWVRAPGRPRSCQLAKPGQYLL